MPRRPLTAVLAALALLAAAPAASLAQDPPTDASAAVQAIYQDYRNDVKIEICDHELDDLKDARDTIEPEFDQDFPDFRDALDVGIKNYDDNCDEEPSATATPTSTPAATTTPDAGTLPPTDDGGADDTGAIPPPEDGTLPPDDGSAVPEAGATPAPPATTAVPTVAPATPAASPTPVIVTRSGTDGLLIPGIVIAVALLCAAALGAFAIAARRSPRFEHAWREAALRTRGTWADFSDWLKLGR